MVCPNLLPYDLIAGRLTSKLNRCNTLQLIVIRSGSIGLEFNANFAVALKTHPIGFNQSCARSDIERDIRILYLPAG